MSVRLPSFRNGSTFCASKFYIVRTLTASRLAACFLVTRSGTKAGGVAGFIGGRRARLLHGHHLRPAYGWLDQPVQCPLSIALYPVVIKVWVVAGLRASP